MSHKTQKGKIFLKFSGQFILIWKIQFVSKFFSKTITLPLQFAKWTNSTSYSYILHYFLNRSIIYVAKKKRFPMIFLY